MRAGTNRSRGIATAVSLIAMIATFASIVRMKADYRARHETKLLTVRQVSERASTVCNVLGAGNGALKQTIEFMTHPSGDHGNRGIWLVDCMDAAGNQVVHTSWDAVTGNLIMAAHDPQRGAGRSRPVRATGAVTRAAWQWMETLGVSKTAPRWTPAAAPTLFKNTWKVVLNSDRYMATVMLDQETHDLIYMIVIAREDRVHTS